MESSAGVLLPSIHLGSRREDLDDCLPKAPRKSLYTYWTTPTQISKDYLCSIWDIGDHLSTQLRAQD